MKKIIVTTQKELDAVQKNFNGIIEVYGGTPCSPIIVKAHKFATIWACVRFRKGFCV